MKLTNMYIYIIYIIYMRKNFLGGTRYQVSALVSQSHVIPVPIPHSWDWDKDQDSLFLNLGMEFFCPPLPGTHRSPKFFLWQVPGTQWYSSS